MSENLDSPLIKYNINVALRTLVSLGSYNVKKIKENLRELKNLLFTNLTAIFVKKHTSGKPSEILEFLQKNS